MDDMLVIGAGPTGLLAAWIARQRGAKVKVMASGIGTTHVSPGWMRVLGIGDRGSGIGDRGSGIGDRGSGIGDRGSGIAGSSLQADLASFVAAHPDHPYALAGLDALRGGIAALREVGQAAGINFVGTDLTPSAPPSLAGKGDGGMGGPAGKGDGGIGNFRLPTALGAVTEAALVPESFAAGDLRQGGPMLIVGPAGWRDFYPRLSAENLARQGYAAQGVYFDLPEMAALSQFDATPVGLAALFERADVRARIAAQLKPRLDGAARVGLPAVLGMNHVAEAWADLQDRLGVPVFEIPTLPPSVPGMRLFNAFKAALVKVGVPILLDMTATRGLTNEDPQGLRRPLGSGVVVPDVVRDRTYRADIYILATGGLYGGGITSDFRGALREAVFGLPLHVPGDVEDWFDPTFLTKDSHPIHQAGVRANSHMQPVDEAGNIVLENVRVAGRLLAHSNPIAEGSTEGVWLATAYRAAVDG